MADAVEQLIKTMQDELESHKKLSAVLDNKLDAMRHFDVSRLESLRQNEQRMLDRVRMMGLRRTEATREATRQLYPRRRISTLMTARQLAQAAPEPARDKILALAAMLWALGSATVRPMLASVRLCRAQAYAAAGEYGAAVKLSQQALAYSPYTPLAHYVLAYAQDQLGQLEEAVSAYEKALSLLPGNASAHYNLGVTYKKLGRFKEAEYSLREAVALQPTALLHQAAMAEVLVAQSRIDEAEVYARKALELEPENPDCHLWLAEIASRKPDLPETLEHLEQAARLDPADVNIQRHLAELLLRMDRSEEAVPFCRRWVEGEPSSDRAYHALGTCLFNLGHYKPARINFIRALKINPQNVEARLNLAWTHRRLRDYDAAVEELRRVARGHPGTPEAREAERFLERPVRRAVSVKSW